MTAKSASVNNLLSQPFRFYFFFNILSEKVFWEIKHKTRSQKKYKANRWPCYEFPVY